MYSELYSLRYILTLLVTNHLLQMYMSIIVIFCLIVRKYIYFSYITKWAMWDNPHSHVNIYIDDIDYMVSYSNAIIAYMTHSRLIDE